MIANAEINRSEDFMLILPRLGRLIIIGSIHGAGRDSHRLTALLVRDHIGISIRLPAVIHLRRGDLGGSRPRGRRG